MLTDVKEVEDQIQKFWSPIFVPELKESALLPSLVSTDYQGDMKQQGDTVYVSMVEAAKGSRKPISADGSHTVYTPEKLKTQRVGIVADQIFEASFELDNLIDIQTQLASPSGQSSIRNSLMKGIELQLNEYLYSLAAVGASQANPDHSISGVADFNFAAFQQIRKLASQAKWPKNDGQTYLLLDPSYQNDWNTDTKNTSADYVNDMPLVGMQKPAVRSGFQILEDNSDAMLQLSPAGATEDFALAFHRTFMYLVMQTQATFKLSDMHGAKKRGYLLSVEFIGGAKLGLQGAKKCIKIYNT